LEKPIFLVYRKLNKLLERDEQKGEQNLFNKNLYETKNKNSFGVHFLLRQNRPIKDKYPVYARIAVNKTRSELALKLWEKEDWNSSQGMAKPKSEELIELNSYLEKIRGKIASHYRALDLDDNILTAEILKNPYLGIDKEKTNHTQLWLTEEHYTMM
jgi:hypothetical protein